MTPEQLLYWLDGFLTLPVRDSGESASKLEVVRSRVAECVNSRRVPSAAMPPPAVTGAVTYEPPKPGPSLWNQSYAEYVARAKSEGRTAMPASEWEKLKSQSGSKK